jgi:hypothetical protein
MLAAQTVGTRPYDFRETLVLSQKELENHSTIIFMSPARLTARNEPGRINLTAPSGHDEPGKEIIAIYRS